MVLLSEVERRLILRALGGMVAWDEIDPVHVDRVAGKIVGTGLSGGWAAYNAGQHAASGGTTARVVTCRRLVDTLLGLGETFDQVRDFLVPKFGEAVVDEVLDGAVFDHVS